MKKLLVATSNRGKFREFSEMLSDQVEELLSLADFPQMDLPPETGATFEENAIIKARHAAVVTGIPAIADDSGLEVDYLGGRPGVLSARFAGESATDRDNNEKLLAEIVNVPEGQRGARFVCCIAYCRSNNQCTTFLGELNGRIIAEPKGDQGFGYDPLFLVSSHGKTLAELDMATKNAISHRSQALAHFRAHIASDES